MKSVRFKRDEEKRIKRRGDDRGMTLLELIIAVAIFSIAAMSLLQAFVTSGRINNKSNLYLEATTTAQNVMEEIKAKTFTDIAGAFNYPLAADRSCRFSFLETKKDRINPTSTIENPITIKEVLKGSDGKYTDVIPWNDSMKDESSVTASVISKNDGDTYELNPRTTGTSASKYYFEMTGVECLSETFDVLVEFDGSSSTDYKKSGLSAEDEKNDYEMPNIAKLDGDENGFLIRDEDWGLDAVEVWWQNYSYLSEFRLDETEEPIKEQLRNTVLPKVERTLTIRLRQEAGIVTAEAMEHFEYKDSNGDVHCTCTDAQKNNAHTDGYSGTYTAFFSTKVGSTLEGLYIFYYPNYNSTSSSNTLDNIIFDNTTGMDVNLYVVKQNSEKTTSANEQNYHMSLTVKESLTQTNWTANPSTYRAQTVLRTNLNYDISSDNASRTTVNNQMSLTYQTIDSKGGTKSVTKKSAETVLDCNGLDDREATDRIYTVKVKVYKEGAADENFPDEDLVATLDGAKED